jgi:hypothetical protein
MMRRGACLLTLLGMTVQSAVADDAFFGAAPPPSSTRPNAAAGELNTPAIQKFTRSRANLEAGTESDLRSYYDELFGAAPPQDSQPAAQKPGKTNQIIHAEFEQNSASQRDAIQQVHAERFNAKPFPGTQTPDAQPPSRSLSPAGNPAASATAGLGTAPETPSRSTVTFSRSNPAAPARPTVAAAKSASYEAATSSTTAAPAVNLEWRKQSDMNVGQECTCQLVVKNSGQSTAQNVEVRAFFPNTVRLVNAKPAPARSEEFLGWELSELPAGEERCIEITLVPMQRGEISTRADVRFSGTATGSFAIAEPMLEIELEGPAKVLIGEPASQVVSVKNPGTGIASHVQIEAIIPDGLEHPRGQRLQMELGNLNPGESRSVRLALAATKGGHHQVNVQARAESGLVRTAATEVEVIAPSLVAQIDGPGLRYLGRQGTFLVSISNDGAAASDNVQLRYKVPVGFEFVSADRGAQYDAASGLVNCFIGRLERGQKSEVKILLAARQTGEFKHLARASSEHGAIADAEFATVVEGTPSLAMHVKDLEDPVEVSSETTYEIRVRNEGSAGARSVGVVCELPLGMSLVSAQGPTEYVADQQVLRFKPLPELAAGQFQVFKVRVAATNPGTLRFKAHLSSESIDEPLTAEELTKFYGE